MVTIDDKMIESRLQVLKGEESMYTNQKLDAPPHIAWERGLIARIKHLQEQLDHQVGRIVTARENLSLRACKKCTHLHMQHHICYMCGHDDSIPDDEQ